MREIRVGLIGFGTVGSGVAEVLRVQAERLRHKVGADIRLVRVADLNLTQLPREYAGVELTSKAEELITAPDLDIVVELIGGIEPAKTFILKSIAHGKHVITANKALIAQHGREIFAAAAAKNVELGFEASVGGGIPVIKALKEGLVANRIESIVGIMNGTSNYILNRMSDEGLDFATVLKEAQAQGYAEADPAYDIEGIDAAHKLVIIMSMAYGAHFRLDQVCTEGISRIEPIDIEFAREFGYRIKLLAISRNHGDSYEARVHPTMIPDRELLANIGGAFNAIQFTGDMVGDVLFYGQGAGKMPTGSAVVSDIVDIARNIINGAVNRVPGLGYLSANLREAEITPLAGLCYPYYFRVTVQDKPGVLSAITRVLGEHGISIRSVIQQNRDKQGVVPVMMRTYEAREDAVRTALVKIDALDVCAAKTMKIRIMDND